MRDLIIAILALTILCFGFSSIETHAEIIPTGSWYVSADSGTAISGEGEEEGGDAFIRTNQPQETTAEKNTAQAQPKSPITVSVVYPDQEHAEEYRQAIRETFLIGVAVGALLAELVTAFVFAILYLREKAHGHQTGKA